MIPINNSGENKRFSVIAITATIVACLAIVGLVVVYYIVMTNSVPDSVMSFFVPKAPQVQEAPKAVEKSQPVKPVAPKPEFTTKVIKYSFPGILPVDSKTGSCFAGSIAQPFRQDAFRCSVGSSVYDPCFSNEKKDAVVCQMNPINGNIFVINLAKPLPAVELTKASQNNWAWFLELEDGTICSPYTGTRPLVNQEPAYYGCKAKTKGDMDVLMGNLTKGQVWIAKRIIVTKDAEGTGWDTKSSETVKIKNVWQ